MFTQSPKYTHTWSTLDHGNTQKARGSIIQTHTQTFLPPNARLVQICMELKLSYVAYKNLPAMHIFNALY